MSCPGFFRLENLWKKGVIFFDEHFPIFSQKKIMLVSVKINSKKGTIAKNKVQLPKQLDKKK